MSSDPTRPYPTWWQAPEPQQSQAPPTRVRRRRRGPLITLIVLIVLVVLFVVSDRVANSVAENRMASQIQSSMGLSGKPDVNIEGFPFWTQLLAHDFNTVHITASNDSITVSSAGGGLLQLASLDATLHGMHFKGFSSNSATIDQFNASALITFASLGNIGGVPSGVTLTADGPNEVKATVNIAGLFSDSAVAKVTQSGSNGINVQVVDAGGIPASALGNLADFTVRIPKLPAGVSIQSVSVTQQGVRIVATGQNTTLSQ
jgi:LmeA-like phospholipid-binding